ncbi:hypothetical protein LCGC14_0846130 [marine sediment metagenome]|uniref:SIS domain-containing protein n=1 Tax=marine sediment metagenome TaxID=412755 RepID=A0A0F9SIR9_9ZZZZ
MFKYLTVFCRFTPTDTLSISQNGETKGVINSINIGRKLGCLTIAITNYMASNLAKISDISLHLQCSIENSVL